MPISAPISKSPKLCEIFIENQTNVGNPKYTSENDNEKQNIKLLSINNNIIPKRRHSWSKKESIINRYEKERNSQFFKSNNQEDISNTLIHNQLISFSCTDKIDLVKDKRTKSVCLSNIF